LPKYSPEVVAKAHRLACLVFEGQLQRKLSSQLLLDADLTGDSLIFLAGGGLADFAAGSAIELRGQRRKARQRQRGNRAYTPAS